MLMAPAYMHAEQLKSSASSAPGSSLVASREVSSVLACSFCRRHSSRSLFDISATCFVRNPISGYSITLRRFLSTERTAYLGQVLRRTPACFECTTSCRTVRHTTAAAGTGKPPSRRSRRKGAKASAGILRRLSSGITGTSPAGRTCAAFRRSDGPPRIRFPWRN